MDTILIVLAAIFGALLIGAIIWWVSKLIRDRKLHQKLREQAREHAGITKQNMEELKYLQGERDQLYPGF